MAEQLLLDAEPAPLPAMVTCFSMHQPFAGLVAAGLKDETRTFEWPVKARPYPAPLLICATAGEPGVLSSDAWKALPAHVLDLCKLHRVALCLVDIVGCRELVEADLPRSWYWDPEGDRLKEKKRYLWTTANVRRVAPFPVKGMQGFAQRVPCRWVLDALQKAIPRSNAWERAQAIEAGHSVQCAGLGDDAGCKACFGEVPSG